MTAFHQNCAILRETLSGFPFYIDLADPLVSAKFCAFEPKKCVHRNGTGSSLPDYAMLFGSVNRSSRWVAAQCSGARILGRLAGFGVAGTCRPARGPLSRRGERTSDFLVDFTALRRALAQRTTASVTSSRMSAPLPTPWKRHRMSGPARFVSAPPANREFLK